LLSDRLPIAAACIAALALTACQSTRGELVPAAQPCTSTGSEGPQSCGPDHPLAATTAALPPASATPQAAAEAGAAPVASKAVAERPRLTLPPMLRPEVAVTTGSVAAAANPGSAVATTGSTPVSVRQDPRATARHFTRLTDAVASAVLDFPEIGINKARVQEASAGIGIARAGLFPTADARIATGANYSGGFEGRALPYSTASNALDGRFDGGIILRQLLFDFGAVRTDVERAKLLRDAEQMKLVEKIDEIAHRTAQAYLRILEQRALLALVDETVAAHERLLKIVQAHAKEGHGTIADVQRVNSRLLDVKAIRSDVSLQLMSAEDQFERLTRGRAGKLGPTPDLMAAIPSGPAAAIQKMLANNPRLAALQATRQSTQKELEFQRLSQLPKINLEVDTESKNFRNGQLGRTQLEGRAMVAMRYRITDGGLSRATDEQIRARIQGHEMTFLNEREQFEADLRQAYRAIDSARRKERLVGEGVASARRVQSLYLEQFKGGKRTIFELLDGQMAFYTARRSQIESQYEGRRAVFDILKGTGELTMRLSRG
jgi:outer membrane protein, adhesin transport system